MTTTGARAQPTPDIRFSGEPALHRWCLPRAAWLGPPRPHRCVAKPLDDRLDVGGARRRVGELVPRAKQQLVSRTPASSRVSLDHIVADCLVVLGLENQNWTIEDEQRAQRGARVRRLNARAHRRASAVRSRSG
jgi:hypothetical protein